MRADVLLRGELRRVVRRVVALTEVKVRLGIATAVIARDSDGRNMVQEARVDRGGELEHVPRALDVGHAVDLVGRGEVVDRAQVDHVVDDADQTRRIDPQAGFGQITDHRDDPRPGPDPAGRGRGEPLHGLLPDQHVHCGVVRPGHQPLDEPAAQEPRCPGDEIRCHRVPPRHGSCHYLLVSRKSGRDISVLYLHRGVHHGVAQGRPQPADVQR
ncbi:hypothetical protein Acsp05_14530 [Actinokineospora sp. NBRC 105648]|nr:hypothetical protein Acsp05_14530 [Actinokineospora sp. NBRC 105648]